MPRVTPPCLTAPLDGCSLQQEARTAIQRHLQEATLLANYASVLEIILRLRQASRGAGGLLAAVSQWQQQAAARCYYLPILP